MAKNKTIEERQAFCVFKLKIFEILLSPHCLLHSATKILIYACNVRHLTTRIVLFIATVLQTGCECISNRSLTLKSYLKISRYIYIYIYIYTHTHTYIYIYIYIYASMRACVCASVCVCGKRAGNYHQKSKLAAMTRPVV